MVLALLLSSPLVRVESFLGTTIDRRMIILPRRHIRFKVSNAFM